MNKLTWCHNCQTWWTGNVHVCPPKVRTSGYVSRVNPQVQRDHYAEALERGKRAGALIDDISQKARPPLNNDAAIQQAVDDYLLMERKARAWDDLRRHLMCSGMVVSVQSTLDVMDALVHPAQQPSTR